MRHYGDICKISGAEIEPVDCIIGGSPCQDLSIAGKRAGLAGERSGLYMEQIRIIREMREHDRNTGRTGEFVRPRYMVWENVVGAMSSNKGRDFAAVLEEAIRIAEPEAPNIPVPEKGWSTYGGFRDVDGRWSVAWRVLDAQHWGVPQRRRRIALVADFGGATAHEILFNAKGVRGNLAQGGTAGKGPSERAESGASCTVRIRGGCDGGGKGALVQTEKSGTLGTGTDQTLFTGCLTPYDTQANRVYGDRGVFPPLQAREKSGLNRESVFCLQGNGINRSDEAGCAGKGWREDVSYTLNTIDRPAVCAAFKLGNSETARSIGFAEEQAPTLNAECGGNKPAVMCFDMTHANDVIRECGSVVPKLQSRMGTGGNQVPLTHQMQGFGDYREGDVASSCKQRDFKDGTDLVCAADCRNFREGGEVSGTLQAKESGGQRLNLNNTVRQNMVVRRLTPTECERLQGFPDRWTDIGTWTDEKGKLHKESSDSARYKALGNSIALPPWKWVLKRLCAQYERDATMGSLFDGIGGFPLIWIQLNGWNSVKWASEIEPFCIAVTKRHFGDENSPGDAWKYLMEENGL